MLSVQAIAWVKNVKSVRGKLSRQTNSPELAYSEGFFDEQPFVDFLGVTFNAIYTGWRVHINLCQQGETLQLLGCDNIDQCNCGRHVSLSGSRSS